MKEVTFNYNFSLPVWEGVEGDFTEPTQKLVGSEIEPIKLYEDNQTSPYSRNGLDIYIENGWLIRQNGKFFVVITRESGYDHEQAGREIAHSWEAYELPETMQIDRIKTE